MKFRKKPVVIDAVQWWPPGDHRHVPIEGVERGPREDQPWGVATLEGFHVASPGDWIITGVKGERYPCKDDIFRATYEPAESYWLGRNLARGDAPENRRLCNHDLEGDAMP